MTRTSNTFGALAFATLSMFALWTSTLTMPLSDAALTPALAAAGQPTAQPVLA